MRAMLVVGVVVGALTACRPTPRATVGAAEGVDVPADSGQRCVAMCTRLNLQLDSVVVMENAVGCVCRAASAPSPTASASAGAARMVMLNAERARQIAAQQQRRD